MKRALLALAAAACAREADVPISAFSPPELRPLVVDRTIHGDTRFEPLERELAERACLAWGRFSAGRIRLAIVWDYSETNFLAIADEPHMVRMSAAASPPRVAGVVLEQEIRIVPGNAPELYPVILHELGHFVGLEHVPSTRAVMAPRNPAWLFTADDRAECQRVGLCARP